MSAQERDSSEEIQQLRNELQLVMEERQASEPGTIGGSPLGHTFDPGYARGVPFWAFNFSG